MNAEVAPPNAPSSRSRGFIATVAALLTIAATAGAYWIVRPRASTAAEGVAQRNVASHTPSASLAPAQLPQKSVAVLPFLDLTEGMKQEEFADGMTEELIDKLSKVPGLHVPAPTASFYFKGKQLPVADIARTLGVTYLLDGSVRKSGARLRVAARLIRPDSGYVVWSESYDRPSDDILMVQDDIAGQVTKALRASIVAQTGPG
jgi:TolB-like protein